MNCIGIRDPGSGIRYPTEPSTGLDVFESLIRDRDSDPGSMDESSTQEVNRVSLRRLSGTFSRTGSGITVAIRVEAAAANIAAVMRY